MEKQKRIPEISHYKVKGCCLYSVNEIGGTKEEVLSYNDMLLEKICKSLNQDLIKARSIASCKTFIRNMPLNEE